ncbi:zinc finger BED domain-containing protein 1-like [Huso huso]|uniref:Zinc finger BED domain-containing protein 1-like n=1 Tax=Huso huso TaxID=61971 RepID=A0ABR0YH26_HUSHU
MGISACFYNPPAKEAQHVFINLHRISHPHTGEVIAKCIEHTLTTWDITEEKVLLIITDNGANIVKAIKILAQSGKVCEATEKAVEYAENSEDEPDDSDASSADQGSDTGMDSAEEDLFQDADLSKYTRMPCLAHTLQLTLKDAFKHPSSGNVISRARSLVNTVRKSSVATEKMISKCGKTLIKDCVTRWNSTLNMMKRLLETKIVLHQVFDELGIDTLLTSDWSKLEQLVKLFEPFAVHTDQLQTDSQSLSEVVPCLSDYAEVTL